MMQQDAPVAPPSRGTRREELDLDLPLSNLRSFELSSDSGSDSGSDSEADVKENCENVEGYAQNSVPTPMRDRDAEKKEKKEKRKHKKEKKEKKAKRHKRKPRLINTKTKAGHRLKDKDASGGAVVKKDGMRQKVLKAVAEYIEEHGDTWKMSMMREEISEKHGLENNADFTMNVKIALNNLGISGLGGSSLKAQ